MARRYSARIDENQPAIVRALRAAGATVQPLSAVGGGVPDLLVGFRGRTFLLEVKNREGSPSHRALTDRQREWHDEWRGQLDIVFTPEEALERIGFNPRDPANDLRPRKPSPPQA